MTTAPSQQPQAAIGKMVYLFGDGQEPRATIRIHDPSLNWRIPLSPSLATGEAYMDGKLTIEDGGELYDFLDLLGRNMAALESTPFVKWSYAWQRLVRFVEQHNPGFIKEVNAAKQRVITALTTKH